MELCLADVGAYVGQDYPSVMEDAEAISPERGRQFDAHVLSSISPDGAVLGNSG